MSAGKILVVDDEADIRVMLKEILSEEGYDVDVAANAGQARASRARAIPDLVLLDIWMPDTDGITLLREWSAVTSDDCPVVMMSGHGTVETAVEATRLGAFDFVEKPLSLSKLLRTVERAMDAGKKRRFAGRTHVAPLLATFGRSRVTQQLREESHPRRAAGHSLLLIGEAGSGREALARFTHEAGPRAHAASSAWWPARCRKNPRRATCSAAPPTAQSPRASWTRRAKAPCSSTRSRTWSHACSGCCWA